jgi:hypothetical protein
MKVKNIYNPPFVKAWVSLIREKGLKQFVREKGWKLVVAVFLFYLVRDSVLYILVPILIARGLWLH